MSSSTPREDAQSPRIADRYEVVIIGSGVGALACGGLLAKAGHKVLVVERLDVPGGMSHSFQRGPYTIEPAVHMVTYANDGQYIDLLLKHLGVRDRCEFLCKPQTFGMRFPGLSLDLPLSLEAFVDAQVAATPAAEKGIRAFWALCNQIEHDLHLAPPVVSFADLDEMAERFPTMQLYSRATVADALLEFVDDPRAAAICAGAWPWFGIPPSKLSLLYFAQTSIGTPRYGNFAIRGTSNSMAQALAAGLAKWGGDLLLGRTVQRVRFDGDLPVGVELDGGDVIAAPIVISGGDGTAFLRDMVGLERLPLGLRRRLDRLTPTLSVSSLYVTTDLDLGSIWPVQETFIHQDWDHEAIYRRALEGEPGGFWLNVPTLSDDTIAPPGRHIAILSGMAPYANPRGDWRELKQGNIDRYLDILESVYPGLKSHLDHVEGMTPLTLERFGGHRGGAAYGWEATPRQIGARRLPYKLPVKGLYMLGQWSASSGHTTRSLLGGIHVHQLVLDQLGDRSERFVPLDIPTAADLTPEDSLDVVKAFALRPRS